MAAGTEIRTAIISIIILAPFLHAPGSTRGLSCWGRDCLPTLTTIDAASPIVNWGDYTAAKAAAERNVSMSVAIYRCVVATDA